ncbi:hypothetical protein J4436_04315 [Candidatus Woesearchaeota archaeon]|nr:hypothetical protein [Candidatus Woesearchaeota archaeon]
MTDEKQNIPDSWFYLSIITLGIYLIIRLIDQSKMINIFALDIVNDYSSHMAQLYFLDKCGFHNICNYWYNGFELFKSYPPSWFFFTDFFIMNLTKNNIMLSTYISLITMIVMSFITILILGKLINLSLVKRIAFFILIIANPLSIGNFIRLGRMPEFIGWVFFLPLAFLIFLYKEKEFDNKSLLFILFYFLIMISNPFVIILSHILILGLFLIKPKKEKIRLIIYCSIGAIFSSFWWLPYLINIFNNTILGAVRSTRMWDFSGPWFNDNILGIIIPICMWLIFYLYLKNNELKKQKELIFFAPILLVSILFFIRVIPFIPILKHIYPDAFLFFFLFFIIFYLFRINYKSISNKERALIFTFLIVTPIIAIITSITLTPWFNDSQDPVARQTVELLSKIPNEEKYLITYCSEDGCCKEPGCYIAAIYSYLVFKYDISTAGGFSPEEINKKYVERLNASTFLNENINCNIYLNNLNFLNVTYVVSYRNYCNYLENCGLEKIEIKENTCLLKNKIY